MSTQAWTLIGIVVGAVLAGGAQILSAEIGRRREAADWRRDGLKEIYAEILRLGVHDPSESGRVLSLVQLMGPADTYTAAKVMTDAAFKHSHERALATATAAAQGTSDPKAAEAVAVAQGLFDQTKSAPEYGIAKAAFLVLSKRDLGLPRE